MRQAGVEAYDNKGVEGRHHAEINRSTQDDPIWSSTVSIVHHMCVNKQNQYRLHYNTAIRKYCTDVDPQSQNWIG